MLLKITASTVLIVASLFVYLERMQHFTLSKDPISKPVTYHPPEPTILYGMVVDNMLVVEGKVKRNQNLSEILALYNVSNEKIHQLAIESRKVFDVRKIIPRKKYVIICEKDSLSTARTLIYEPNDIDYVVFKIDDSVTVELKSKEVKVVQKTASGVIYNSLAVTMEELGFSPQLTNDFADVFAWQVDFFRLFPGDKFKVIYEEKFVEEVSVGLGRIIGAYFNHDGEESYAVLFNQGDGKDYFDADGNSLQKALLRYPLKFNRISSRYSGRRYHPVLRRYKAHLGTDFAAPRGTPVRSVGECC